MRGRDVDERTVVLCSDPPQRRRVERRRGEAVRVGVGRVRVLVALAVVQRHERGLAPARGGQDVLRPERVGGRVRRGLLEDVADARGKNRVVREVPRGLAVARALEGAGGGLDRGNGGTDVEYYFPNGSSQLHISTDAF